MPEIAKSFAKLLRRMPVVVLSCMFALFGDTALGQEPKVIVAVRQSGDALIVDATMDVQVSLRTAWEVLTDFDHMSSILGNLTSSKVSSRNGNTLIVRQEGVARYGLLSFFFESEREIRLEPMRRILARHLSGTWKRMESEATIVPLPQGVQIKYHAEIVPDSFLAPVFGAPFVRHEVGEQFLAMLREMTRRNARAEPASKESELPTSGVPAKLRSSGVQHMSGIT